jgi:DNA polymerase I
MANRIVLIDGRNLAWRAHWTYTNLSSKKRPTAVIFGFLSMLLSINKKLKSPIVIVWDGKGSTWRHELTKNRKKQYKGNRKHLDKARGIVNQQLPILQDFMKSIGIINVEVPKLEADDLIGIISHWIVKNMKDTEVLIYSGDRDFYQLLSDKIKIYSAQGRKQGFILTKEHVKKTYGLSTKDFVKMRALCGDKSDNISNVIKGVGSKTAIKLVKDGLNPKLKSFSGHSEEPFNKYSDKFAPIWDMVHENYHLSKIICDHNDIRLKRKTKRLIANELYYLYESKCRRDKKKCDSKTYKNTLEWLVQYELDEIFNRRQELSTFL